MKHLSELQNSIVVLMKKISILLLGLYSLNATAQNSFRAYPKDNTHYREHPLDITKMIVEVSFVPEKGIVNGKVSHHFTVLQQNVDSIFFDAPNIDIKTATLNNKNLPFTKTKTGIWVKPLNRLHWDHEGTIVFEYQAKPRKGIYFIGWNTPENKEQNPFAVRKQIWTQGQGIDNRHWIPMYDDMNDKFITETIIRFDESYEVLSNGNLRSKTNNGDKTTTWHYAMNKPHAGYLLMIGIGKYAIKKTKSSSGVPMNLYYYPEFADRAEPTYRHSEKMFDFLEKETGMAYPWDSYAQIMVQDFLYGAMENTTATVFGDFFNVDERAYIDRNYVGVNCHELTHQWFGDCITARDGRDTWLQESYATYYPKMLTKVLQGKDEYDWQRRAEYNTAIEASKKDRHPIRYSGAGTARVYQKGSSVISMLSYVLGEEQWKRALNHYLKKHAYTNVETNDLHQAIQDKLGLDLSWFFDQWIYRGGEPQYTVSYQDAYVKGQRKTMIQVAQTHTRDELVGLFKMPISFEVHYTDGTVDSKSQVIDEEKETVVIDNKKDKEIAFVLFDPNARVLKTVQFEKKYPELRAQILGAKHMLDRYDALIALKSTPLKQKRSLLLEVYANEDFHQMKAEVMNQLVEDESVANILQKDLQQQKSSVKLAAIRGFKSDTWSATIQSLLRDSSYDVVSAALDKLCKSYPKNAGQYLEQCSGVMGMNNSVNIKWHEMSALNQINKETSINKLVQYASNIWEFRTRVNAFNALKSLNHCDEQLTGHLFEALLSTNGRLATPAAQLIEYLAQQSHYKAMFIKYYKAQEWNDSEKDLIKKQVNFL